MKNLKTSEEVVNKDVLDILDIIDSAEPLSGCGMFEIKRSTLTSMISISITYLIVLVQFKMSSL